MPTQAIELQESVRRQAAEDSVVSTKEQAVVEDGRRRMMEILAARAVVVGAARTMADMALKAISADRMEVVEDMGEEVVVVGMDRHPELTEADTIPKVRPARTPSRARVVGTTSRHRVVRTINHHREAIPTGSKAAMILSLVLEDRTFGRRRFFPRYPIASLSLQLLKEGGSIT